MPANIQDKKGSCWPQGNNFLSVVISTSNGLKSQKKSLVRKNKMFLSARHWRLVTDQLGQLQNVPLWGEVKEYAKSKSIGLTKVGTLSCIETLDWSPSHLEELFSLLTLLRRAETSECKQVFMGFPTGCRGSCDTGRGCFTGHCTGQMCWSWSL